MLSFGQDLMSRRALWNCTIMPPGPRFGLRRKAAVPALLLAVSGLVGACTSNPADSLPASFGGLPAGAPERPASIGPYPAVHDIPAARDRETLTDYEQKKLENDLIRTRDRLGNRAKSDASKKEAAGSAAPQQAGARKNP